MPNENIHLHQKYSARVAERFYQESLTQSAFSKDMDIEFTGVRTVKVTEVNTVPMNNYDRTANGNRYGTPVDLEDSIHEYTMMRDRSFAAVIDKGDNSEQQMIKNAGKAVSRQLREEVTPEIDKYRFERWAAGAGQKVPVDAPTAENIYDLLLTAKVAMDNKKVPKDGRTVFLGSAAYIALMKNDNYIRLEALGGKAIPTGKIGEIFGMDIKYVPDDYLPANVCFMIIYKNSAISPVKLHECKVHKDPVGYSGHVLEGRFMYDAFVKQNMKNGIYVASTAAG